MNMYQEHVMDHYRQPRNSGILEGANVRIRESNPVCGDVVELFGRVEEGMLEEVGFVAEGCAISQAATSMLTEKVKGMKVEEILGMENDEMIELIGIELSAMRIKCALLGMKTLQKGLVKDA